MGHTSPGSVGAVTPQRAGFLEPLILKAGKTLASYELVYETYGTLNADKSNAVLVCHALSGSHHVAGYYADDHKTVGWWDNLVGPGKPIDTDRFFVIGVNNIGGCHGSTGPGSIDRATGQPYGASFPVVTVEDWVASQARLMDRLGIERLAAAIGGSLGGMQALQWALDHPGDLAGALVICASSRLTAQNIAFSAVAREAIMRDPEFRGGEYHDHGQPAVGLSLARMIAHITYLSERSMREKFGRRLQNAEVPRRGFDIDFQVESYLQHQGQAFLRRFDALSYLYLSRCMDYFEPFADELAAVRRLRECATRFLVISFDTDWRFDTSHSREIVRVLQAAHRDVSFREIGSPWGHDSFLLEVPEYHRTVAAFLRRTGDEDRAA